MTFLKNAWYVAAYDQELDDGPLGRTILGEQVVLFKDEEGEPAAVVDRCPHRFAALSQGRLVNGQKQCGYHGLTFDRTGKCTRIPSQKAIPSAANIKSFPVTSRYGLTWIWMGDAEKADPSLILPELSVHSDPDWYTGQGYLHVKANYKLYMDNLLDLSHLEFVHASTIGNYGEMEAEMSTKIEDDSVRVIRAVLNQSPVPIWKYKMGDAYKEGDKVDFYLDIVWKAPAMLLLSVDTTRPGGDRTKEWRTWGSHLLTPETDTTSHYFYLLAWNFRQQDAELAKLIMDGNLTAFLEDKVIIEHQQEVIGEREFMDMKPVLFKQDTGPAAARQILEKKIKAEQEEAGKASSQPRASLVA